MGHIMRGLALGRKLLPKRTTRSGDDHELGPP